MLGKVKVMDFERREVEVGDFNTWYTPYEVSVPAVGRCEVVIGREKMEQCYANMKKGKEK